MNPIFVKLIKKAIILLQMCPQTKGITQAIKLLEAEI